VENAVDLANLGKVSGKDGDHSKDNNANQSQERSAGKGVKNAHGKDDNEDDDDDENDKNLEGLDDDKDNDKDDKDKKKTRMSLEKGEEMDAPQQLAQYYMMVTTDNIPLCTLYIFSFV